MRHSVAFHRSFAAFRRTPHSSASSESRRCAVSEPFVMIAASGLNASPFRKHAGRCRFGYRGESLQHGRLGSTAYRRRCNSHSGSAVCLPMISLPCAHAFVGGPPLTDVSVERQDAVVFAFHQCSYLPLDFAVASAVGATVVGSSLMRDEASSRPTPGTRHRRHVNDASNTRCLAHVSVRRQRDGSPSIMRLERPTIRRCRRNILFTRQRKCRFLFLAVPSRHHRWCQQAFVNDVIAAAR